MRKLFLLIIVSSMVYSRGFSQDYQACYSGRTLVFENPYEGLKFQRADSVSLSRGDSVFWFLPNFDMDDYYCIRPDGPNWLGEKLIVRENGDNVFFNKQNDSILIKTQAQLNSAWLAYTRQDALSHIWAEVIQHDTLTFLGITDSVKTIRFQVSDENGNSIAHLLNDKQLKISKHYGLIKTFMFRDFPDFYPGAQVELEIKGISSPEAGMQNLTWKDVFDDFYPGDQLHVLAESCYGTLDDSSCEKQKSIFRYLHRTDYQDSLKYRIERISGTRSTHNGVLTGYVYTHDTITSVIRFQPDMMFNRLSEESIIRGDVISYHLQSTKHLGSGQYVTTKTLDLYDDLIKVSEDCWEFPISDVLSINPYYMKGLGGPYYHASMWDSYSLRKAVYFKKADQEWGSPLTISDETGIEQLREPGIVVFPNPARDYILLKTDLGKPLMFELIDLHGRLVLTEIIDSTLYLMDTSGLKSGIYLYRLIQGEQLYQTGKLQIH